MFNIYMRFQDGTPNRDMGTVAALPNPDETYRLWLEFQKDPRHNIGEMVAEDTETHDIYTAAPVEEEVTVMQKSDCEIEWVAPEAPEEPPPETP